MNKIIVIFFLLLANSLFAAGDCDLGINNPDQFEFNIIKSLEIDLKSAHTIDQAIDGMMKMAPARINLIVNNLNQKFGALLENKIVTDPSRAYLQSLKTEIKMAKVMALRNTLQMELSSDFQPTVRETNWPEKIINEQNSFFEQKSAISHTLQNDPVALENWKKGYLMMLSWVKESQSIDKEKILLLAQTIMGESNSFRHIGQDALTHLEHKDANYLPGALVENEMEYFFKWFGENRDNITPVELAAKSFVYLISIHPMQNGNGRLINMILDWILLQNNLPPAMFNTPLNGAIFLDDPFLSSDPQSVLQQIQSAIQ